METSRGREVAQVCNLRARFSRSSDKDDTVPQKLRKQKVLQDDLRPCADSDRTANFSAAQKEKRAFTSQPQPSIPNPQSAIRNPQSAVRNSPPNLRPSTSSTKACPQITRYQHADPRNSLSDQGILPSCRHVGFTGY